MTQTALLRRAAGGIAACVVTAAAWAAGAAPTEASPRWNELTAVQQQALAPLQRDWSSIDVPRRQKWVEVASRFPTMGKEERERVQQRMAEWARMTPGERARARLQFQEVRNLPPEERQARWQAYQALSDDEKRKLAQAKPTRAASAVDAAASRPRNGDVAKRNLVVPTATPPSRTIAPTVVQARPGATTTTMSTPPTPPPHHQAGLPKIAATPGFVDPATLLPRRGPQGAAAAPAASAPGSGPRQ